MLGCYRGTSSAYGYVHVVRTVVVLRIVIEVMAKPIVPPCAAMQKLSNEHMISYIYDFLKRN